jgi:dUTP pyrophosphatase
MVPTGIALELPLTLEAQVRPRSGLAAKHGVTVLNSPGTIDADFRGEVCVLLVNHGDLVFEIERGDRIAQLVFSPVCKVNLNESEELTHTQRGQGGFGHTGVS